jgi:type II secretory pathway pseudopilin PulG
MKLAGQAQHGGGADQRGYAMAALLVAMSIAAVMATVVMPVWKQMAQREKEEELIFRGKQYVHAIGLFQRKYANAYPPNIDVLIDQRFLRKKYKDPITNEDFVPMPVGQAPGGTPQVPGQRGTSPQTGGRQQQPPAGGAQQPSTSPGGGRAATSPFGGAGSVGTPGTVGTTAGISGVTSKSKDQSIRLYNGRGRYNEWAFVYIPQQVAAGAGAPGSAVPGQVPGQRGGRPGGPGQVDPFNPGQRGGRPGGPGQPDPFNPGQRGGFGTPGAPGGGRGFGPGQTPIQPPNFPRGRF